MLRHVLGACVTLVVVRYFYWRFTSTLPSLEWELTTLCAYAFCGLEIVCAYWDWKQRRSLTAGIDRSSEVEAHLGWFGTKAFAPLIDILIPTYDENRTILRNTIIGASNQAYPRFRVWVLDDGRRPWVAELCAELGVCYLSRNDNSEFKAGNLNHAVLHLHTLPEKPRYVAVFDADFVASPAFLERAVALMHEPRVALVQTPQYFCNPDVFQYAYRARWAWPESWRRDDFYDKSADARGFARCLGTSFLLRVDALLQVRGFPRESLLEDLVLTQRLGPNSIVFLDERLSVGFNAAGLAEKRRQYARWSRGEMQVLVAAWRSWGKKLAFRPRFALCRDIAHWFADPVLRLAWLVVPVTYWLSGTSIVRASPRDTFIYSLSMVAPHIFLYWLSRGAVMPIADHIEKLSIIPTRIWAGICAIAGWGDADFAVTPKGLQRRKVVVHWHTVLWMGTIVSVLLGSMIYRWLFGWSNHASADYAVWNVVISCWVIVLLMVSLLPCIERPRYRKAERYFHRTRVPFLRNEEMGECELIDLSIGGAKIHLPGANLGETLTLFVADQLGIEARLIRQVAESEFGVELHPTLEQEGRLINLVLFSNRYLKTPKEWSWWSFCAAVVRGALGIRQQTG